jgi:hypothetical protein
MNQSEIVSTCGFTDKEAAIFQCRREMENRKYVSFADKVRASFNVYAPELPACIGMVVFIGLFSAAVLAF